MKMDLSEDFRVEAREDIASSPHKLRLSLTCFAGEIGTPVLG
jgi:hypothetical protein